MLLIIDNQSSFIKTFKRNFLSEHNIDYIVFDHNQPINLSSQAVVDGIILSGGKGNPYQPLNLTTNFIALMNYDVPIMGMCLGCEIIAVAYRGRIKKMDLPMNKKELVEILVPEDPIFNGLNKPKIQIKEKHSYNIYELPKDFVNLATSESSPFEAIRHPEKPIYGFQGHPEVQTADGLVIMKNFLSICDIPFKR